MRDQSQHRQAVTDREAPEIETETETEAETERTTRFGGGGKVPAVGAGFADQPGTSQLAFEDDSNERELKEKVGKLVSKKFGGDFKKAFTHYDQDKDGAVAKGELVDLLHDAGVGNGLTRGVWASKIIDKLDTSGDSSIQWAEFESVFRAHA